MRAGLLHPEFLCLPVFARDQCEGEEEPWPKTVVRNLLAVAAPINDEEILHEVNQARKIVEGLYSGISS